MPLTTHRSRSDLWAALPLCALVACLLVVLLYELARRVAFPWDLYIWSESPFMTNMLKLSAGEWPFTVQTDANSFVYSPGLEFICYALLRPLGLELDVRACRVVVVALGFGASACVTGAASLLAAAADEQGREPPLLRAFVFPAAALLVFRNFAADVCHPDNLFILHAMASLYLAMRAVKSGSYRQALVAVTFASLATWAKQTALLGGIGVAFVLVVLNRARWSRTHRALLVLLAAAVTGTAIALLRINPNSRLFLFDLLLHHPVYWARMSEVADALTGHPYRILLLLAGAAGALRFLLSAAPLARALAACWAMAGLEVLPALGAFLKANGLWNNFTIIEVWLSVVALPAAWALVAAVHGAGVPKVPGQVAAAAGLAALVLWLVPAKLPPSKGQYAFGQALENSIARDLSEGKRVLLPHGTMPFIRAGQRTAPRDRSNSVLELRTGGFDVSETLRRIEQGYYSRIYMFQTDWYGPDIQRAIYRHYHPVGVIQGDHSPTSADDFLLGYGNYMRAPVRVVDVNQTAPALAVVDPAPSPSGH